MDYALIKNNTCINKAVFDNDVVAMTFRDAMIKGGFIDNIVPMPDDFDIGDYYIDNEWSKREQTSERKLTEFELLQQKVEQQDEVIEELLFEIIPRLMEGGAL